MANQLKTLQEKLDSSKIFTNMIIHDIRSPNSSIKFVMSELIQMFKTERKKDMYMEKKSNKKV
jgi:hypothetical protein